MARGRESINPIISQTNIKSQAMTNATSGRYEGAVRLYESRIHFRISRQYLIGTLEVPISVAEVVGNREVCGM